MYPFFQVRVRVRTRARVRAVARARSRSRWPSPCLPRLYPVMYSFFQLTMLIIFVVTIFVLPKLCFFGVGLHPRLFRRHGPKEVRTLHPTPLPLSPNP